ncbi:fluoride efflux transporter FluC [Nocardioides coralli]|uniref:fluoride efflux transporter FluC n=1 Tax=Nocardioides coralli TaxID=2872154 RepID=UPI001CA3A2FC|nr:CrcB family protein [Nocardioides coralli]QZY28682.1 CrcB family protein [Nocardioides coralli]
MPPPDRPALDVALVAAGGALGSVARWWLASLPGPWPTLVANITGCFVLGLLSGWLLVHRPRLRRFAGIGFLGGYTTFSTHLLDAQRLAGDNLLSALAYVAGTLVLCLAAAAAGLSAGRRLERR